MWSSTRKTRSRSKHLIAASIADGATVNPNGIKILLANGLSKFPIKGNSFFKNGPKFSPEILSDQTILLL